MDKGIVSPSRASSRMRSDRGTATIESTKAPGGVFSVRQIWVRTPQADSPKFVPEVDPLAVPAARARAGRSDVPLAVDYSEWTLAVSPGNPARRLYERLGFLEAPELLQEPPLSTTE